MQVLFSTPLAALFDLLPGILGAVVTGIVSFILILLVSSYYRFQHIVEQAENTQPEAMGATPIDILRVQLARYLAGCARRNSSFVLALIQLDENQTTVYMDSPVLHTIKKWVRCDDVTCVYNDHTIALLMEAEPEDSESILKRIIKYLPDTDLDLVRVGISVYPEHGLSAKQLIEVANQGIDQADPSCPVVLPEIIDEELEVDDEENLKEEEDEKAPETKERRQRKKGMLDDLTGVLKPSAVSAYMQRLMSDLRQKKKKAALFCIGLNNVEHIAHVHGEEAVDDVLISVSDVLKENLRAEDLLGRHEKYAFLVLLQASLDEAEIIGKRISTLVQHRQIISGKKKLKVTITLGVAAYPEHGRNLHNLHSAGQKVLDYNRLNDIRAYAVYDPEIHDKIPSKPMKSIKSVQV